MEYCGEVMDYKDFQERAERYDKENRRHYYFMTLRADEVIIGCFYKILGSFSNDDSDGNKDIKKAIGLVLCHHCTTMMLNLIIHWQLFVLATSLFCCHSCITVLPQIIDATFKGNLSRFINHSCDSNCETQKVGMMKTQITVNPDVIRYN